MSINPNSPVPIYLQIVDYISQAVASGVYRSGEKLPSLRSLALDLGVNPNTVQHAYDELEREGLVQSRKGVGIFVTKQGAKSAKSKSENSIRQTFSRGIQIGQNVNLTPERIRSVFDQALKDTDAEIRRGP
ncbi:MAG: GntR family transcriptional regulator [Planctomycetota bacterium]|jgi:GntR family transcriptional regulator